MASSDKTVIAFDLYGTLLSTESIAKELTPHFGEEKANSISALWRRYQLEYTWRLNSMSLYKPLSDVTNASLRHALAESGVTLLDSDIEKMMKAYDSLETFPDVPPALASLQSDPRIDAYVFSNGTEAMVSASVHKSPSLSRQASIFKGLITVDDIQVFKPNPKGYQHLATSVGKSTAPEDMATLWLVSGNPFDVVGARSAGMQAAWVDRAGGHHGNGGWNDRLGELASGGPTVIVKGLDDAVTAIRKWTAEHGGRSVTAHPKVDASLGPG